MNAIITPGRILTASGFIGLSILCVISEDFIVGRPPAWPTDFNFNPILGYSTAALLFVCAVMIFTKKNGGLASIIIAVLILLLSLIRHLIQFVDWLNALKTAALLGGALIVAVSFLREDSRLTATIRVHASARNTLTWVGCILLAAFFIAAGYAHFKFDDFVKNYIPAYIPFRSFWTYFTAICLYAGGIGILIPQTRKWAALLSGVMVLGWFLLLHIPKVITDLNNVGEQFGLGESLTFAGMFLVLSGISKRSE